MDKIKRLFKTKGTKHGAYSVGFRQFKKDVGVRRAELWIKSRDYLKQRGQSMVHIV